MSTLNLPPTWSKMSFTSKAGYLSSTHQAKDYRAACQMIKEGNASARPKTPSVKAPVVPPEEMWWNK